MSGDIEAAGAAVTAGLAGGAIEGQEARAHGEGACANCGAPVSGRYCAQCGQGAHVHRTLGHFIEESLHGVLHFDSKLWRTLPMLAFRPGGLTRAYAHGKRARYISPLALFLFSIFLMYFVFSLVGGPDILGASAQEWRGGSNAEVLRQLKATRAEMARAQAELEGADGKELPAPARAAIGQAIVVGRQRVAAMEAELARRAGAPAIADAAAEDRTWQEQLADAARKGEIIKIEGAPELSAHLNHKLENPDLLLYKVQQAAYKLSFLLVPISLPFVALMFVWKRGVTLYDHAVFVLYSLSFMSLLFLVGALVARWAPAQPIVGNVITAILPAHMYFQLKGGYALGWFSAAWRTVALLFGALCSLIIFGVLIVLTGLAG
jgi:hypothetical protein